METDLDTLRHFVGQQLIRGKLTANTANSYASSISRVFSVAAPAEAANVLGLDLDVLFSRFRTANADLGEPTAASYESRVRAAINQFREYAAREGKGDNKPPSMGTLAIPLRGGVVRIDGLPSDMTPAEANRIAAMIVAMGS